jgi:hypothetical protein
MPAEDGEVTLLLKAMKNGDESAALRISCWAGWR